MAQRLTEWQKAVSSAHDLVSLDAKKLLVWGLEAVFMYLLHPLSNFLSFLNAYNLKVYILLRLTAMFSAVFERREICETVDSWICIDMIGMDVGMSFLKVWGGRLHGVGKRGSAV